MRLLDEEEETTIVLTLWIPSVCLAHVRPMTADRAIAEIKGGTSSWYSSLLHYYTLSLGLLVLGLGSEFDKNLSTVTSEFYVGV